MNFRALQQLDLRTRRLAAIGLLVLVAALLYAYVWLPSSRGRVTLAARLPVLESKLAMMQVQAGEIKRLNSQPAAAASTTTSPTAPARFATADKAALEALFGNGARVSSPAPPAGAGSFQISITNIAYTTWLDRLDQARERFQLRANKLTLKPIAGKLGEVSAEFTLTSTASVSSNKEAKS
jgi:type II secretory pathway component PulM